MRSGGEGYLLSGKMLLLVVMMVLVKESSAQVDAIKPLSIGDTVPDALWNMPLAVTNLRNGKESIRLIDYKDKKLIILDFWATWCAPCVESLPTLEKLDSEYNDIIIMPITNEASDKILKFLNNRKISIPSVVEKNELPLYFPHKFIPHQIWIFDNKISKITGDGNLSSANIKSALLGNFDGMKPKRDLFVDYFEPITTYASASGAKIYSFSCITGYMEGTANSGFVKNESSQAFVMLNRPVISLYREALGVPTNKIVIESNRKKDFLYLPENGYEHIYCYQFITAISESLENIRHYIVQDLNKQFNINGQYQKRLTDCYVIEKKDLNNDSLVTDVSIGETDRVYGFETFLRLINYNAEWSDNLPLFVDESSFQGDVFAKNPASIQLFAKDINELNKFLNKYNLVVSKKKRWIDLFVINDLSKA